MLPTSSNVPHVASSPGPAPPTHVAPAMLVVHAGDVQVPAPGLSVTSTVNWIVVPDTKQLFLPTTGVRPVTGWSAALIPSGPTGRFTQFAGTPPHADGSAALQKKYGPKVPPGSCAVASLQNDSGPLEYGDAPLHCGIAGNRVPPTNTFAS